MQSIMKDITGQTFGRLLALWPAGKNRRGEVMWACGCVCGGTKVVVGRNLRGGVVRSCTCRWRETLAEFAARPLRHGHSRRGNRSPTYQCWKGMLQRCTNPKADAFKYYGGRGICVCVRWLDFENFLADMGERPRAGLSIDRIDNNGNYEPANCRWATRSEQSRNRRPFRIGQRLPEPQPVGAGA